LQLLSVRSEKEVVGTLSRMESLIGCVTVTALFWFVCDTLRYCPSCPFCV